MGAIYCSRECQKKDWEDVHRLQCTKSYGEARRKISSLIGHMFGLRCEKSEHCVWSGISMMKEKIISTTKLLILFNLQMDMQVDSSKLTSSFQESRKPTDEEFRQAIQLDLVTSGTMQTSVFALTDLEMEKLTMKYAFKFDYTAYFVGFVQLYFATPFTDQNGKSDFCFRSILVDLPKVQKEILVTKNHQH
jgi:hypothetical protein